MILIVDDKSENLIALSKTLESRGFSTDTAGSGEIALKKVLKQVYDLVILDVQMPGMDGFEVADAIRGSSKTKNLPIIFLSAVNVSKEFIQLGYASGGNDYLVKPFDTDILILKIQTFIRLNQMQIELQSEVEQRKKAESKKDEFISIASHELNTPLTSLKGYLHLASNSLQKEQIKQAETFVERSINQANKLKNLVADLLDTSKIEAGKLHVSSRHFDFGLFLKGAIENTMQAYPEKQVHLTGDDMAGVMVWGDDNRLEQVLQNYLGNAVKYAPDSNDVGLDIRLVNNEIKVCVSDRGIGIATEKQRQLFDKFYRADENTARFQGLGMGLYICAEIIREHHGHFGVESVVGQGSTFYFTIPVVQTPEDAS